jgi:hypothetical protein
MSLSRDDPHAYFESQGGWPEGRWTVVYQPTPGDWAEYARWRDSLPAGPEPEPEDLGEPQGQCFPDEEPPW